MTFTDQAALDYHEHPLPGKISIELPKSAESAAVLAGVIVVALFIFMVCSIVKAVLPAGT